MLKFEEKKSKKCANFFWGFYNFDNIQEYQVFIKKRNSKQSRLNVFSLVFLAVLYPWLSVIVLFSVSVYIPRTSAWEYQDDHL